MAKKSARVKTAAMRAEEHGGADSHSDQRDALQESFRRQLTVMHSGAEVLTQTEAELRCSGLALPSLCLRWVFCQDALPLGRTLALAGMFRSNKTALSMEITRWFLHYMGVGWYFNVERKDSPDMRAAIMNHDPNLLNYINSVECGTQQQWQGGVNIGFQDALDYAKAHNKGRFTVPIIATVDSVAAAKPQEEMAKFMSMGQGGKAGAGSRSHPSVALLNSDWMQYTVHKVAEGPFMLIPIQHTTEKAVEGMPGVTKKEHKGGGEFGFAKTMALELRRSHDIKETANGAAVEIEVCCSKNSLGPTGRKFPVQARWWYSIDPITGTRRQEYVWDWHGATIQLLTSFEKMDGRKTTTWKDIKEVCDLHVESGRRVWSRALGIPSTSPVSFSEAGAILEYDHRELLLPLYNTLRITRRHILKPGGDLKDIWGAKTILPDIPDELPYPRPVDRIAEFEDAAK